MGRLINTTAMTVDGVIDVSDWYVAEGEHDAASLSLFTDDASMLLGRKTYEGLAGFWPTQSGPWADRLNAMPKYVASRSQLGPLEWNAAAIEGDAIAGVRQLKARHDGDLVMSGCGELARELIQAGVVDEILFWIHPRIQGPGTRPFEGATVPVQLLEAKPFDSGVTLLRYEPIAQT
ncbi:MAG TPA: dihydrofolate reductase family protein [Jiangellaceae bacterium]|jgi:dihydrofolate reductase